MPYALREVLEGEAGIETLKPLPSRPSKFSNLSIWALFVGLLSLITPIGFLVVIGAILAIIYDSTELYELRKTQYEKDCISITKKNLEIKQRNRQLREISKIDLARQTLAWIEKSARDKRHFVQSNSKQGMYDNRLFEAVKSIPGSEIQIGKGLAPNQSFPSSPQKNQVLTPDVIFHVPLLNLWIDLEVDEPWFKDGGTHQKVPIHYLGLVKDPKRDDTFLRSGWIVIRFAEEQVALEPKACAREVAKFLTLFGLDLPNSFHNISDVTPVKQWTETDALQKTRLYR